MLNLRHIEVFHAVYETGSVSAAARALHVSQPSVSKVLRHAESRIGLDLFRLVKGRLVPTHEAHELFREAREVHARMESLYETAKNLRGGGEGRLRLAVLPSLGLDVAPAAVAGFRKSHPGVAFEIQTLHNEGILRSLYERSSDLAFAYDAPHHPRLAKILLGTGELVLLYRKTDYPDAPARVSRSGFGKRDLIQLNGSGSVGALFSSKIGQSSAEGATISVQTYYVAAALVRHGAGYALVDEFTARANQCADLDFRPLAEPATFNVYCVHLEDRPLSRIERTFIKGMQKELARAGQRADL